MKNWGRWRHLSEDRTNWDSSRWGWSSHYLIIRRCWRLGWSTLKGIVRWRNNKWRSKHFECRVSRVIWKVLKRIAAWNSPIRHLLWYVSWSDFSSLSNSVRRNGVNAMTIWFQQYGETLNPCWSILRNSIRFIICAKLCWRSHSYHNGKWIKFYW